MSGFRGDDETLEREIATLEGLTRVKLRRYAREMRDLEKDLKELRAERQRRRGRAVSESIVPVEARAAEQSAA